MDCIECIADWGGGGGGSGLGVVRGWGWFGVGGVVGVVLCVPSNLLLRLTVIIMDLVKCACSSGACLEIPKRGGGDWGKSLVIFFAFQYLQEGASSRNE